MNAFDQVTQALCDQGCSGKRGSYQCPVHQDRNPSLSVSYKNDKVLLHCFAGCETEAIVEALGMTTRDLFDSEPKEVARYRYVNDEGVVQFAKVRYEPKKFQIIHPTDTGWEYGMNGSERPLYRLPEIRRAVAQGLPVYVVEGEKDADRLWETGAPATCNFGGAAEWRDEYADYLKDADVIVIADRDAPGIAHAAEIRRSLRGVARSVRIVQSRTDLPGDDVSDHLDAGYDLDELVPYTGSYKAVSLASLLRKGVPSPVPINDFLYQGGLHSIAGPPDCGKSTLALFWALSIARAGRGVLFLDEEGGAEITAEKLAALGAGHAELESLTYVPFPGRSWNDDDIASLLDLAMQTSPALLLIDSSAAFMARAGMEENSASDVTRFWSQVLTPVAREAQAAVLVIDHDTKSTEQSRYARGSGAKLAAIDVQIKVSLEKPFSRTQDGLLGITVTKDRRGHLHRHWEVEMRTAGGGISPYFHRSQPDQSVSEAPPARKAVYAALNSTPMTYHQLNDAMFESEGRRLKRETMSRELNELRRQGLVDCIEKLGLESRWYRVDSRGPF